MTNGCECVPMKSGPAWGFCCRPRAYPSLPVEVLYAKLRVVGRLRHQRKQSRHELASALALLQRGDPFRSAYLAGAHHGRVRLSIRSLPGESPPENPNMPFALG